MTFNSLQPFIPSGPDYQKAKDLFVELGFSVSWDAGDYTGFERDGCKFILQKFNNKEFAENLMISVNVSDVDEFLRLAKENHVMEKFGIRISEPSQMPYGKEVNVIDLAGVCWHFVEG
jgi:hypothetical protein